MNKQVLRTTSLLLVLSSTPSLMAWGVKGHAVVADIAEAQLTPEAAADVHRLLATEGARHISDISAWADQVKRDHLTGSPDHSVRLPLDGSPAPAHPCPDHFCADDALTLYEGILEDRSKSDADREVALKYVVHLVGDLQQPLHTVDKTGSHIPVEFDGRSSELHKIWDDGIIDDHGGSAEKIARELTPLAASVPASGEPDDWAQEGREIAQSDIYKSIDPNTTLRVNLPSSYAQDQWPIVARRLAQGGGRLAAVLNRCLGKKA